MKYIYSLFVFSLIYYSSSAQAADSAIATTTTVIEETNQSIYNYLLEKGLTIKEESSFYKIYHSKNQAYKLYEFFKNNNITNLAYLNFYNKYLNDTVHYLFNSNWVSSKNIKSSPKLLSTWKYLFNQGGDYFFMKPDFEYDGGEYIKVWLKTNCNTYIRKKIKHKNFHYVELMEFNLKDKKYNPISFTLYNNAGTVIENTDYDYTDWRYIIPDTVMNEIFNYIKDECDRRQSF